MKQSFHILSFILFLLLFAACESSNCPLNNIVESVYVFYASERTADGTFQAGTSVKLQDTLTVTAFGTDSLLVNRLVGQSGAKLPVSYYQQADTLVFTFTDSQGATGYDTICIEKDTRHHFDDPSCPVHMFHTVKDIHFTRHLIDTIIVSNASINYDGAENFQVYFRTTTDSSDQDTTSEEDGQDE